MTMMMINFYRKSLHSFMSFADTASPKSSAVKSHHQHDPHGSLLGLGGLISSSSDINIINNNNNNVIFKSPNILESSSLLKSPRNDPASGVGFIQDDVGGGGVDGLTSCTESLGFESSDERLTSPTTTTAEDDAGGGCLSVRVRRRRSVVEERKFPPPLTSLNQHGHPNFYLRPVRRDGRLELTEVRIQRTEILRACREDGRLRLHLIKDHDLEINDDVDQTDDSNIIEEKEEEIEDLVKEGNKMELRRCVQVVNHHHRREHHRQHHHHLDVWRQHCVTTS